jgi:ABC-type nitrate/sulfonate/bicarbonate transport system permease component
MNQSDEENQRKSRQLRNRQLALFSVIVAEVVVTPSGLGGAVYWLLREHEYQTLWTGVAALVGLGVAFYRIYLMNQRLSRPE